MKLLMKLIDQLPAPNKSTLEVLMTHLCLYVCLVFPWHAFFVCMCGCVLFLCVCMHMDAFQYKMITILKLSISPYCNIIIMQIICM